MKKHCKISVLTYCLFCVLFPGESLSTGHQFELDLKTGTPNQNCPADWREISEKVYQRYTFKDDILFSDLDGEIFNCLNFIIKKDIFEDVKFHFKNIIRISHETNKNSRYTTANECSIFKFVFEGEYQLKIVILSHDEKIINTDKCIDNIIRFMEFKH